MNKFEEVYLKIISEENLNQNNQLFSKIKINYAEYRGMDKNPFENENWKPPYIFNDYNEFLNFLETDFLEITGITNITLQDVSYYKDSKRKNLPNDFKSEEDRLKVIDILNHCSNIAFKNQDWITIGFLDQNSDWCLLQISIE